MILLLPPLKREGWGGDGLSRPLRFLLRAIAFLGTSSHADRNACARRLAR